MMYTIPQYVCNNGNTIVENEINRNSTYNENRRGSAYKSMSAKQNNKECIWLSCLSIYFTCSEHSRFAHSTEHLLYSYDALKFKQTVRFGFSASIAVFSLSFVLFTYSIIKMDEWREVQIHKNCSEIRSFVPA